MRMVNFMAIWKVNWKEFRTILEKCVERIALSIRDDTVILQPCWVLVDTIILQGQGTRCVELVSRWAELSSQSPPRGGVVYNVACETGASFARFRLISSLDVGNVRRTSPHIPTPTGRVSTTATLLLSAHKLHPSFYPRDVQ
jgi:hypothetical protein